jgi:hypothetical protein
MILLNRAIDKEGREITAFIGQQSKYSREEFAHDTIQQNSNDT